jgi:anion-transporting  ArsA/GET3 family ATPase
MVREYLEMLLPVRAMASLLYRSNLFSYLAAATPGLQEVVSIGKAYELTLDERRAPGAGRTYDIVIVDAPATGHGIGFLEAPGTFRRIARGGPLADQASRIERTITDRDASGVGIVASPEEMAVNESAELAAGLEEAGVAIEELYVNGLVPERFTASELERIRSAREQRPSAALDAAIAEAERARAQRAELARLRTVLPDVPVHEIPFLFTPELGLAELRSIAEVIA